MMIDQELTFIRLDGRWLRVDGLCIIEIKSPGRVLPFDRILWARGFRPTPASKFALGVCLTNPQLPDNRWHRLRCALAGSLVAGDRDTIPISATAGGGAPSGLSCAKPSQDVCASPVPWIGLELWIGRAGTPSS